MKISYDNEKNYLMMKKNLVITSCDIYINFFTMVSLL